MDFIIIPTTLTNNVMCIYKMMFDSGHYYIGGTSDLCNRIDKHKRDIKKGTHTAIVKNAMNGCSIVTFEVLEFINDRTKIKGREDLYIQKHFGLPKCLNTLNNSVTPSSQRIPKWFIVKFNERDRQVARYSTIAEAAKANGFGFYRLSAHLNGGSKTIGGYYFKRVTNSGKILENEIKNNRTANHAKAVVKYNSSGEQVGFFRTIYEAAREVGIDRGGVKSSIANTRKSLVKGLFYYKLHS